MIGAVRRGTLAWLLVALAAIACGRAPAASPAPSPTPPPTPAAAAPAAWVPGLGELMSLQQMRHTKLWLAAQARNWKLAAYELDELKEGFADIARLHATHKNSPVPVDQAVETIMTEPLERASQAIAQGDGAAFATAYDTLTEGCNSCHQATDFGFNVVQRPKSNPYPNQVFAPPR